MLGLAALVLLSVSWGASGTGAAAAAAQQAAPAALREAAYRANNLGVAHLEQYDYEGAAAQFRKALEAAPDLLMARVNLAIALYYKPDLAGAREQAHAVVARQPDNPQAHYVLGLVARAENEPEVGAREFATVLATAPNDLGARVGLGQIFLQQRRFDEAVDLFRAADESEPFNITAAYNLAIALTRSGRQDEGQQAMARFQALRESGYGTNFSNNYLEQGRYAEALTSSGLEPSLVDRTTPAVRFEPKPMPAGPVTSPTSTGASAPRPAALLFDLDLDGDLDLLTTGTGAGLARNESTGFVPAVDTGLDPAVLGEAVGAISADYDNDGPSDLLVVRPSALVLYRQDRPGHFVDRSAAAGVAGLDLPVLRTAAFVDADHDGDVDIVAGGRRHASAPAEGTPLAPAAVLLRNNGDGTFADVTRDAGLADVPAADAVVPTDYDNRRDVDLLFVATGEPARLYRNLRTGAFADVARDVGLSGVAGPALAAVADVNKDEYPDFVLAGRDGALSLVTSDGSPHYRPQLIPGAAPGLAAVQIFDYDSDGLLDVIAVAAGGLRVWRNVGDAWIDATASAVPDAWRAAGQGDEAVSLVSGDLDGDGDTDLLVRYRSGRTVAGSSTASSTNRAVSVRLTGRVSNRRGVGAKLDLRAGSLRQKIETSAAFPAPVPADVNFGLGARSSADVARILWPSGVVQAEALEPAATKGSRMEFAVTELDRKPSSCPFLYTWNGERFEFATDFLGGGELGYWVAPGLRGAPDPDEYVRIAGDRLLPRGSRYELRITNELEEALFLDKVDLLSIAHPAGTEVYPDEGLGQARRPFALYVTHAPEPPRRATDARGRDVLGALTAVDRNPVDGLPLARIRGYADEHALTLDLGPDDATRSGTNAGRRFLLLLTGWTDYAFSSDNVAASQSGMALRPPALQVRDKDGTWRTVVENIGVPVGRPQTIVVDLTDRFLSASRDVRIVTTMRIYWDQALVDRGGERIEPDLARVGHHPAPLGAGVSIRRLDLREAQLRWRGFSAEQQADGPVPLTYDYERVSQVTPWKVMPGRYTREGDVGELLGTTDDMFVVSRPGDDIALAFDAGGSSTEEAERRTFLLFAHGYSKEMDINSASPDETAPLPFRAMTTYPYRAPEAYPQTPAHVEYLEKYNTRIVSRPLPPIEAAVAPALKGRPTSDTRPGTGDAPGIIR
jgi:hypothetical protein